MYLKKIEMQGFKSFADKTVINFEDNVTAIVGPNGSGKSNVSDAVRWVLGEQSAKSLRGGKMEDVIFSGTEKRKPLGYAEVKMTFNNETRIIPIDYAEVEITRRMFRSGESEFYINKTACRLKDIKELIMDTGIGRDGYSIIGQGRISEILSDKPEERRGIFEEAAGIVKYKSQKEESERKLIRTEENLSRISDLFFEVKKQNDKLEKESKKAREYLDIFNELKIMEINAHIKDISECKLLISNLDKKRRDYNQLISSKEAIIEDCKNKLQEYENKKVNINFNLEIVNEDISVTTKKIENIKNNINLLNEKIIYETKERERLNFEIEKIEVSNKKINEDIIESEEALDEAYKEMDSLNYSFKDKKEALENFVEKKTLLEREYEESKNKDFQYKSEINSINNTLNSITSFIEKYNIEKEEKEKSKTEILSNKSLIDIEVDKIKSLILENNLELEKSIKNREELSKKISNQIELIYQEKNNTQILRSDLKSKINNYRIYKNMEDGYEGFYKSVKNLLTLIDQKTIDTEGYIGVVADLIDVEMGYERAIDTTLGSSVQNIVTLTDIDAKKYIEILKNRKLGRVTFLPVNKVKGNTYNLSQNILNEKGVLGLAKDFVKYEKKIEPIINHLLGRTIIVDNIDSGVNLSRKYDYRIVSLEGDVFSPGGSMTGGSYSKNALSIISRKNKIESLKLEISSLKETYETKKEKDLLLEEDVAQNKIKYSELEQSIKTIENKLDELDKEYKDIKDKALKEDYVIESSKLEINSLDKQLVSYENQREDLEKKLSTLISKEHLNKEKLDEKTLELEKINSSFSNMQREINNYEISKNNISNKIENYKLEIVRKKEELLSIESTKENYLVDIMNIENNLSNINNEIENGQLTIETEKNKLEELNKDKEDLDKEISSVLEEIKKVNALNKITSEEYFKLERENNSLEVEYSKINLKLENYNKQLFLDYDLDYERALEFRNEDIDVEDKREKIIEYKKQINRIGNVNLDSIEEYKKVNERYLFLESQQEDLLKSKADLEKVIKDMEKEMADRFVTSLEEINSNFGKVFEKLFNGGKASIVLEDQEDILKSGIEIKAQPPGKKLQNIRLLSGGEKSLTAVALLFSILELKPSPFCILDEIDAALDDANIGRYTEYLKSLNDRTQFILITHRKPTMEISKILYGVTMKEDGVSSLYSLKIKDYIDNQEE